MSQEVKIRHDFVRISATTSAGLYPAITLVPPEEYCTDPHKPIWDTMTNDSSVTMISDGQAEDLLKKTLEHPADGTSEGLFEKVQVRDTF